MRKLLNLKLLALTGLLAAGADAQYLENKPAIESGGAHTLTGTWKVRVSPSGLPPATAYNVFHADGTSVEFDNSNPPSAQTIAVGPWARIGPNQFVFTEVNQLFDEKGNFIGELKVRATIQLDTTGNKFTSRFKFDVLNPNGNVMFSGDGTAAGERLVLDVF